MVADPLEIGVDGIRPLAVRHLVAGHQPITVAGEILDAIGAEGAPEVLRRHVLQLVGLVDDRVVAVRNDLTVCALAHRGVGTQQMMVDDDDVGFGGALPHASDEAVGVAGTRRADTVLRAGGDLLPEGQILGQVLDFGAVAGLRVRQPSFDHAQMVGVVRARHERREGGLGTLLPERVEAMEAQIVAAPLHVGRLEVHAERLAEHGQILEIDLLLEVLGAGGDEDALETEDRRHQVGEGLAGASARFDEQHAAVTEPRGDGGGHRQLGRSRLEACERPGDAAAARGKRFRDRGGELYCSG